MSLTHFNEEGRARMVDVGEKDDTKRVAVARGYIEMKKETIEAIKQGAIKKGDVLAVAQVAGIMGAKKTSDIIPMCHNIFLSGCDIEFQIDEENSRVYITAKAKTVGKTGVEMEALTAVSTAALTIYDMCKAIDKEMIIGDIKLIEKKGGKSGHFVRSDLKMGKVVSVNISEKKGVVKNPVNEIELVEDFGVKGDAHAGKWHRQVSLLAEESIDKMKKMGLDHLDYGKFAENITTQGIDLPNLKIGTRMIIGEAEVEVTQIGKECHGGCEIKRLVGDCVMPREGIFVKVLKGGKVRVGDDIIVIE
ncbi:Molybdenum cofactor biosynthesis protein MoaC [Thermobrachium celere DSM 8682]|uniref:Cyclic pyranopterin monophosphate synthase n=2 Tax=Thermobrachium TaxID=150333 RepID=R7RQS2_9CLOT|nr:Molybdenum cofactor biosynthesis protein MoaC [Thermobrachium celere DSM 8682]